MVNFSINPTLPIVTRDNENSSKGIKLISLDRFGDTANLDHGAIHRIILEPGVHGVIRVTNFKADVVTLALCHEHTGHLMIGTTYNTAYPIDATQAQQDLPHGVIRCLLGRGNARIPQGIPGLMPLSIVDGDDTRFGMISAAHLMIQYVPLNRKSGDLSLGSLLVKNIGTYPEATVSFMRNSK